MLELIDEMSLEDMKALLEGLQKKIDEHEDTIAEVRLEQHLTKMSERITTDMMNGHSRDPMAVGCIDSGSDPIAHSKSDLAEWRDSIKSTNACDNTHNGYHWDLWCFDISVCGGKFFTVTIHHRDPKGCLDQMEYKFCDLHSFSFPLEHKVDPALRATNWRVNSLRAHLSKNEAVLDTYLPKDWDLEKRLRLFVDLFNVSLDCGAEYGIPYPRLSMDHV